MDKVKVKLKKMYGDAPTPFYHHEGDSGMDVYAYIKSNEFERHNGNAISLLSRGLFDGDDPYRIAHTDKSVILAPGQTVLVKTGLSVAIPNGYEFQVRPTSGNSLKKNLTVNNTPGTVDAPYRGEIGVILHNNSMYDHIVINHGDKIAQLVLCPVLQCVWEEVESLDDTTRGDGGYGSTENVVSTKS